MTPTDHATTPRVGEVIEATSTAFVVQCYELYAAPPLGSFVETGDPWVYGVVQAVLTQPLDPSRPILARGEGIATEEELYRQNPQIHRLLTTRFEALIVGHEAAGALRWGLPPHPPRVHSFVHIGSSSLVARLTTDLRFVEMLFDSRQSLSDEAVRSVIQLAASVHADPRRFLIDAGRAMAAVLSGDLPRLNAILRRLKS
jgi:hypothetical protein